MKRLIALTLTFLMIFSLSACDSADYRKAEKLLDSGDYEAARVIFAELGDYEDSKDKVLLCRYEQAKAFVKEEKFSEAAEIFAELGDYQDSADQKQQCDYKIACSLMDEKEYAKAREIFLTLGEYEDSAQNALKAAHYMVMDYVKQKDKITKSSNGSGTVIACEDGALFMAYYYKATGLINIDLTIATMIKPGQTQTVISGKDSLKTYAAYYTAEASSAWDISTYTGQKMKWENFEVTGKNAYNRPYEQSATWLELFLTTGIKDITAHLSEVLQESGLGLTMKDLGFEAYQ